MMAKVQVLLYLFELLLICLNNHAIHSYHVSSYSLSSWTSIRKERYFNSGRGHVRLHSVTSGSSSSSTTGSSASSSTSGSSTEEMTAIDEQVLFGETAHLPLMTPARHRHISLTGNLLEATNLPINPLDHSTRDPLINALRKTRDIVSSCPGLWVELAKLCGDKRAVLDEHLCDQTVDLTFADMSKTIQASASAFLDLGVEKGVNVALFAENSAKWLIADHGIQLAGGASVVRGADAPPDELRYIYSHSDSKRIAVLQNVRLLQKLEADAEKQQGLKGLGLTNEAYGPVQTIILLHREKASDQDLATMERRLGVQIHVLSDLLERVTLPLPRNRLPKVGKEDLSTIVYTSGTTGRPKGVMLTHGNLLHQIGHRLSPTTQYDESEPLPGELTVSLLPVWHITERTFELWLFSRGCHVVYSTVRTFKNDLANHQPQWMVLVPRVLEKIALGVQAKFAAGSPTVKTLAKLFTYTGNTASYHSKVTKGLVVGSSLATLTEKIKSSLVIAGLTPINAVGNKLLWKKVRDGFGGRVKAIICGGSALSGSLETFFETCGITICVGYGLTECSPLLAFRRADANLVTAGCIGTPTCDTEIRIVPVDVRPDFLERQPVPDGEVGVVIARGPQIMKGYYKNPEATDKAIDRFGWFDTGDLGRINPATGDIILTGRCKDTIVLSNGENVEPSPIEDAILSQSSMIEQVMLTGQDMRSLVAIVVLNPSKVIEEGFLDTKTGERLMAHYEKINSPQCSENDCKEASIVLQEASENLRSNDSLSRAIQSEIKTATATFRKWEQVGHIYITVEPFAMSNGLLTQSYKVKRDSVLKKYEKNVQYA